MAKIFNPGGPVLFMRMTLSTKHLFSALVLISSTAIAQRGIDGNKTVNAANTIVNEYTTLTVNAAAGATTITVAASGLNANTRFGAGNTLAAGDLIMIIQMQGVSCSTSSGVEFPAGSGQFYGFPNDVNWGAITAYNNCGNYEFCQVKAVPSGTTITVDCGLQHDYTVTGRTQIIRVPRYNTLTVTGTGVLTCPQWATGGIYTGGVLAVEVYGATVIQAGGQVTATGLGFRGGSRVGDNVTTLGGGQVSRNDPTEGAEKGEGVYGYQNDYNAIGGGRYCRGAGANSGGGGDAHNAGGGGGANAGTGTWDGEGNPDVSGGVGWVNAWNLDITGTFSTHVSAGGGRGGYSFSSSNQNATTLGPKVFQSAGSNAWGGDFRENNGGWGGRILDYSTGKIFLGGGGGAGDQENGCGGDGGNGGGLVYMLCYNTISGSGTISANGAAGANTTTSGLSVGIDGAGGAGGGGTIILNSTGAISGITANANGGVGGNQTVAGGSEAEGPGGGGGGGYIARSSGAFTATVNGGVNGTTNSSALSEFPPNGATKGGAGLTNQPISTDTVSASNVTICSGNTATLNATLNGTIPATITWYNAAAGGTVLGTGPSFTTPALAANTTYYVGFCPGTYTIPVVVTVNTSPTASVAGPNQTVCATSATMGANTPAAGTGTWTLVSGAGTITTPSSPTTTVTALGVGANVFQWTITNPPCGTSSSTVTITSTGGPTTSNAGSNQTVCGTTATLAGNTPTTGTGAWTLTSGSGTITTPSSPTSGVTGLGVGANVFTWTISSSPCPPSTSSVTITGVAAPTTANAGPAQSVCGTTATLAGNSPATGTGTWTLTSGTGTITTPSSPTSGVTGLGVGPNVFTWTITNAPCTPSTSSVTITGVAAPTTANAGPAQSVCGTTATLAANSPAIGTGTWTLTSGTGTITTPSSPTSGVTGLGVGPNVFTWTITNAPCTPSTSSVTITGVAAPTTANAGPPQSVCGTTATLAGNSPATGTGTWTLTSGAGTITTPSSPTSGVTGLGVGPNVFTWTISNAPCTPSTSSVTITGVAPPTTANAGPAQSVCGTTATLAANSPAVGTGTWTLTSGTGTITAPSSPTSGVTGLGVGPNVFTWTITNAPCTPSTSSVTITGVAAPTTANAGPPQSVCGTTATLAANSPAVGTGNWTLTSGAGTITTPSSPTSGVTGLGVGPNVFTWTISNAPCTPSTSSVTITGVAAPTTANAGPAQTVCGTTATLAANSPAVGTGNWTLTSGAGTITTPSSPTSGVTGLGVGPNVFTWTITNAPCTPSTSSVTITGVAAPTTSNAGPNQTICGTTATLAGNAPTTGTGTWTLVSGTGVITTPSSPTSGVTGLTIGSNVFQWTIDSPPCTPSTSTVTITVTAFVDATITSVPPACIGGGTFNMSAGTSGGTWTGTGISPGGTFDPASSGVGSFTITYTISGSCGASDTAIVTIVPYTSPVITAPSTICISGGTVTLSSSISGVSWSGSGITSSTGGTFDPAIAGPGPSQVIITDPAACGGADTVTINVVSTSDPTITAVPTVCAGSPPFNLSAATVGGVWSGPGITNPSTGTFTPTSSGVGTFQVIYTISGTCGAADTTNVTVTNVASATITSVTPVCADAAPFTLSGATAGGTWSGSGITDPVAGTFTPSSATIGVNTITYSIGGSCGDTATQNITVNALPAPNFSSDISSACGTACPTFTETVSTSCASMLYDFGDGSTSTSPGPQHCYNVPGTYNVTLTCTDANGCTGTITVPGIVTVNALPVASFMATPPLSAPGTAVSFTNNTTGAATYSWNFNDPSSGTANTSTLANDSHTYAAEGSYCITMVATSAAGCTDTVVSCVIIADEATIMIPNVFTPNGDGHNDIFYVTTTSVKELTVAIYDRWGLKIANWTSTDDSPNGWDGRTTSGIPATDGTYFYILHAKTLNDKEIDKQGYLQLLKTK
ncbi:MAG: PKD domain-containing protein [Bacteroidia bacterium]